MQHKIKTVSEEGTSDQNFVSYIFHGENIKEWDIKDDALLIGFHNGNFLRMRLDSIVGVDNMGFGLMDSFMRVPKVIEALSDFIASDVRNHLVKTLG